MLSSLWQVIVVPSVAKINTFWVAAKPSNYYRKIRLCVNSGLHVFWFAPVVNKPRMPSSSLDIIIIKFNKT